MARRIDSRTLAVAVATALLALAVAPWAVGHDGRITVSETPAAVLQLPGTGNVNVTTVDNGGRVLHNVQLTLNGPGYSNTTRTDINGTAKFLDVPANSTGVDYTLVASLSGYMEDIEYFKVIEGRTIDLHVVLIGGTIYGVVTDTMGRPVNATVSAVSLSPPVSANVTTTGGAYAIVGLPSGVLLVNATASGFRPENKSVVMPLGGTVAVNFILSSLTGSIAGHVYESRTGTPLFNASVSVQIGALTLTVATDIAGSYNITGVPAGLYTVTASKEGYNPESIASVEVTKGNRTEGVDFTLTEKPTRLYGVVRSGTLLLVGVNVSVVGTSIYNTSGPDGSYEIRNLTAGEYTIVASAVGYQTQTISNLVIMPGGEVQQNINMVGLPGGILRGIVYLANSREPLANVQVTIVDLRPQPISRATNIHGEFEFAGLAAGNYTIHLEKSGYRPIEIGRISVTEGEPVELVLEMTPLREGFAGFIFGFDIAHSMMILALLLTIVILAVAVYLRVRSFQTPENAPAIYDEREEEGPEAPPEGEREGTEPEVLAKEGPEK